MVTSLLRLTNSAAGTSLQCLTIDHDSDHTQSCAKGGTIESKTLWPLMQLKYGKSYMRSGIRFFGLRFSVDRSSFAGEPISRALI